MSQIELIRKYDIHPVKRFGQNFLIDENIQNKILNSLPLGQGKIFLEIGPGLGALTLPLLKRGEQVAAIEVDKKLQALLETELSTYQPKHFTLIKDDALNVLKEGEFQKHFSEPDVLIGNLPYNISTPLLFAILELASCFEGVFVTLQKEVVDRLVAKAGSEAYGRLSVSFGFFAHVKKLFDIAPGCFSPKPEVWSSFISVEFREKRLAREEKEAYLDLVKIAFSERRKQLAGLLARHYGLKPKQAEDFMVRNSHSPQIRAENLKALDFWHLLLHIQKFKS
jgi:16S rRNA (adenine1518-N6/adenine1519-N6)-dimethyltransferase